jgi:hypothetical protein
MGSEETRGLRGQDAVHRCSFMGRAVICRRRQTAREGGLLRAGDVVVVGAGAGWREEWLRGPAGGLKEAKPLVVGRPNHFL